MDTVTLSPKLVRTAMRRLKMSPYDLARAAGLGEAALKAVLEGKPVAKSVASMLAAALSGSIEGLSTVVIRACSVCGKEFELPPQVGLYSMQDHLTCSERCARHRSYEKTPIPCGCGCGSTFVPDRAGQVGIKGHCKPKPGPDPRVAALEPEIVQRYRAGETLKVIGAALNLGHSTVSNALERQGVERRPPGQSKVRVRKREDSLRTQIAELELKLKIAKEELGATA